MKKSSDLIAALSVVGAALLCLMPCMTGFAQSYAVRPTCDPKGQCRPNVATFGFNDTDWRQWPVQPRPEQDDPKTIGGTRIPTPPPILEPPLPHAESLPPRPSISGGTLGTILPSGSGSLSPSGSGSLFLPEPGSLLPSGSGATATPDLGIPPSGIAPRPAGSGVEPLRPLTDPLLPGGTPLEKLAPTPAAPAPETPKIPDKDVPVPKSPTPSPDLTPSPPAKPDERSPAKPLKDSSFSRRRQDAVAARATTIRNDLPMQANWNASLEPEVVGDNHLRSGSFQQRASESVNPLRCAMEGYCPVELQNHDRWVAGNPDLQISYQGHMYHFSSEAAQKRFEAAPEKYAPAHGGDDVVLAVEENRTVPGSVNHSAVWQGRLYLFANSASLAAFQEDPSRYTDGPRQTPLQIPANSL